MHTMRNTLTAIVAVAALSLGASNAFAFGDNIDGNVSGNAGSNGEFMSGAESFGVNGYDANSYSETSGWSVGSSHVGLGHSYDFRSGGTSSYTEANTNGYGAEASAGAQTNISGYNNTGFDVDFDFGGGPGGGPGGYGW